MASKANSNTLEAMWKFMGSLTPATPDSELQKVTTFYEPDAIVYLNGMTELPCTSHETLVAATKTLAGVWALAERKITVHLASEDGLVLVNAMENHLKIIGQSVDKFPECEVVKFSERGLIKEYQLFVDPAPVMAVLTKANESKS